MQASFTQYLKSRSLRCFRALLTQLAGVSACDAYRFRDPQWPDHRWGVGQDGSIAGIVYHVAAWKQMTLPIFEDGGRPQTRAEFITTNAPAADDWPAIVNWLTLCGELWNERVIPLTADEMESSRDWEGNQLPLSSFIVEMMEHDIQHTAQIVYLKQRLARVAAE